MGQFVYWMNVSLDLRIERAPGDNGSGEWLRIGESLHREFNARARELAVMVQGRVIYETMEEFWPRARTDDSLPEFLREYGEIWTDAPKVLVSRTRTSAEHNTRIVGGDDAIVRFGPEPRELVDRVVSGPKRTAGSESAGRQLPRSCCGPDCSTN